MRWNIALCAQGKVALGLHSGTCASYKEHTTANSSSTSGIDACGKFNCNPEQFELKYDNPFALPNYCSWLPTEKRVLLGARRRHFEVFPHWGPP